MARGRPVIDILVIAVIDILVGVQIIVPVNGSLLVVLVIGVVVVISVQRLPSGRIVVPRIGLLGLGRAPIVGILVVGVLVVTARRPLRRRASRLILAGVAGEQRLRLTGGTLVLIVDGWSRGPRLIVEPQAALAWRCERSRATEDA